MSQDDGNDQGDLFTPWVRGSDTSHAAAQSVRGLARGDERRVYAAIASSGDAGATDDELEASLSMRHQTASARRRGLVLKGLVVDGGARRKTRSGRQAVVWVKSGLCP